MKSDREIARNVLERRNAFFMARQKQKKRIARAAAGTAVLCLMAAFGVRLWQADSDTTSSDASPSGIESNGQIAALGSGNDSGVPAEENNDSGSANRITDATPPASGNGAIASAADSPTGTGDPAATESSGADCSNNPAAGREDIPTGDGPLSVSYSSLSLPQGQIKPDILSHYSAGSQSTADILPFDEDMLSKSSAILEGTITDMYLKHYTYDTYNDKFGPKELYHNQYSSIVYELTVDRVWYGDESLSGTSVLIEDDTYLMDSYFSLKVGRSYVIPVSTQGSELQILDEYAGGDLTRDGRYTTLYPHHPQIEVTLDGDYMVTTDWETLCSASARDVELDIPENTLVEYHPENKAGENGLITTEWRTLMISAYDAVYYYDKLKLIKSGEFFIQLNRLIDSLPQPPGASAAPRP